MSATQLQIPLGDLEAACQMIVTRLADYVCSGGDVELGYLMYRNQLQDFRLLTAGTAAEAIVRHAQNALDTEYQRLKGRPDLRRNTG